jgi:hypothetical protein
VVPVVTFNCNVPDAEVVLEADRAALKPVAPAGAAKLRSAVSDRPPAASFLQIRPRRRQGRSSVTGRMASIVYPGRTVGEWGARVIEGTPPSPYWLMAQVKGSVAVRPWSALVAAASSSTETT